MSFRDAKNRDWAVRLDLGLCLKLRNALRLDLLDPTKAGEVVGLLLDRERLGNVLWAVVAEQATAASVNQDSFFSALDSDAISAGWGALADAFTDFSPSQSREAVRNAIAEQTEALQRTGEAMAAMVKGPAFQAAVAKAIENATTEATTALEALGN